MASPDEIKNEKFLAERESKGEITQAMSMMTEMSKKSSSPPTSVSPNLSDKGSPTYLPNKFIDDGHYNRLRFHKFTDGLTAWRNYLTAD